VGRPDFKPGEGRTTSLVGSTPTLFRHHKKQELKNTPFKKTIVLVGGGHAHVEVIRQFAMFPINGIKLILISDETETPYSGMVPGLIAGHYNHNQCHISLGPLCTKAGVRLHKAKVVNVDVEKKIVYCEGRPELSYDLLSINIGSKPYLSHISGAEFTIPAKPISTFISQWSLLEKRLLSRQENLNLVVIGGGAAGVEISLCLHHRVSNMLSKDTTHGNKTSICLVTDRKRLLENHSRAVTKKFVRLLEKNHIRVEPDQLVTQVTKNTVETNTGLVLTSDFSVVATHASAPDWLSKTELSLDCKGFIKVDHYLKSVSHPDIFAAGDIATHERNLPKNGVHAVRQGAYLAESLKRAISGELPARYAPQKRTLALISTGNKSAIASYGSFALQGDWLWRVKNWIDIRWMKKYNNLSMPGENNDEADEAMRCGGCGSKVSGVILDSVIAEVDRHNPDNLIIGLDTPDDSAVFSIPNGNVIVKTVDQFRSFIDDPYLLGVISTNHALNDIYAMGAKPIVAMALVTLPYADNRVIKNEISQVLSGINETLKKCGVALVGGHTGEGPELSIGMSITGFAKPDELLRKSGLRLGDALVLTRPLGSGTLLAAHMRAKIDFGTLSKMFTSMMRTNEKSLNILNPQNVSACTDVTGFGLLGHLGEMATSSKVHIKLLAKSLPLYDGVLEAFAQNIFSTLHAENKSYSAKYLNETNRNAATDIMFDPQTSGGFLAGVESNKAETTIQLLKESGDTFATVIGYVIPGEEGKISIAQVE